MGQAEGAGCAKLATMFTANTVTAAISVTADTGSQVQALLT